MQTKISENFTYLTGKVKHLSARSFLGSGEYSHVSGVIMT